MEIQKLGLRELNHDELININGGGQFGNALRSAWNAICDAAEWVWDKVTGWCYDKYMDYTLNNMF